MAGLDTISTKSEVKEVPPHPINTYEWEDLRRLRRKGGYPWTHLYKTSFDEVVDPNDFKIMESIRKTKSSSDIEDDRSGVMIQDITGTSEPAETVFLKVGKEKKPAVEKPQLGDGLKEKVRTSSDSSGVVIEDVTENDALEDKITDMGIQDITEKEDNKMQVDEDTDDVNSDDLLKTEDTSKTDHLLESADSSADISISLYLDKEEKGVSETTASSEEKLEIAAGPSSVKSDKLSHITEEETQGRTKRAKSEEPRRKRKHSIDSSYSRVSKYSLSKLGVIKKLKEAKDKMKLPSFFFSKSEGKLNKTKSKKIKKEQQKPVKLSKANAKPEASTIESYKAQGPLYVHIPLKPPAGETDEFSYLEFEDTKRLDTRPSPIKEETPEIDQKTQTIESPSEPETPITPGVQFIILTAPSDDEILDDPTIPETPSDSDKNFFETKKIDELKTIAKDVVDKYSPETKRKLASKEMSVEEFKIDDNAVSIEKKLVTNEKQVENIITKEEELVITEKKIDNSIPKEKELVIIEKEIENSIRKEEEIEKSIPKEEPVVTLVEDVKIEEVKVCTIEENPVIPLKEVKEPKKKKKSKKDKAPDAKLKEAEKVIESQKTDDDKIQEQKQKETEPDIKITTDVEDGLKETEIIIAQIITDDVKELDTVDELKSSMKSELSPVLKKKVSFKRRSKNEDSERIYEDVEVKTETISGGEAEKSIDIMQSMSIDEEKTYLDDKIIKDTSLEDDYNKWSKINDHEYEPVNPPDENKVPASPSQVSDSDIEFLAAKAADIELRTTGIMTIDNGKGEDAVFVPLASAFKSETLSIKSGKSDHTKDDKKDEGHGSKIKAAFNNQATNIKNQATNIKNQADKLHTRMKSIKRPNIHMPKRPKMKRPSLPKLKIEKPKISMPKIPDQMKIRIPSFGGKTTTKHIVEKRQFSTESNAGDSKKKLFDFSTYPRIFSRKKKHIDEDINTPRNGTEYTPSSESTTLPSPRFKFGNRWKGKFSEVKPQPQTSSGSSIVTVETTKITKESERNKKEDRNSIRIPLHSEGSMDRESLDLTTKDEREREDSVERRMAEDLASSNRYDEDVAMDDAYMKENQEIHRASSYNAKINNRWSHGTFHDNQPEDDQEIEAQIVTDLDNDATEQSPPPRKKLQKHTESSDDIRRRGVLEEINSDEFFLRQKGISQDNIEVGAYLSSEIREAFRTPTNALSDLQNENAYYNEQLRNSDLSLQEAPKRKILKKPKRKKQTPHVSSEVIQYDQESIHTEPEEYPRYYNDEVPRSLQPERPKRKKKQQRETYDFEDQIIPDEQYPLKHHEISDENILSDTKEYYDKAFDQMYENEQMSGIEQPGIVVSDPYQEAFYHPSFQEEPTAPPRRHRSLKSLTTSEPDSITHEINGYKEISHENMGNYRMEHEYQIPTPEGPPRRPSRNRSRTRSHSRATTHADEDHITKHAESSASNSHQCIPCSEEPCCQTVCDHMGYTIIDKSKSRDPPLPPCAPRRSRSLKSNEDPEEKFFTVPRTSTQTEMPVRPLRNYSTLGPNRPPRKRSVPNLTDEEKEDNIDQYIEITDDYVTNKALKSGEVVRRMKHRPLPAPPRPARKVRESRSDSRGEHVRDISQERSTTYSPQGVERVDSEEIDSYVQTSPVQFDYEQEHDTASPLPTDENDKRTDRGPITEYEHQETITHGTLVVQPFKHDEVIEDNPLQMFSRDTERIITVTREVDNTIKDIKLKKEDIEDDETSEIPEDFKKLKDPEPEPITQIIERIIERQVPVHFEAPGEVELLKAKKLQVTDLDVDRLAVNELHANKIRVGEIDSSSIQVSEINSNSGNLVVSGIELPASFFQQLVEKLQEQAENIFPKKVDKQEEIAQPSKQEEVTEDVKAGTSGSVTKSEEVAEEEIEKEESGQKKTSFENRLDVFIEPEVDDFVEPPHRPPRSKSESSPPDSENKSHQLSTEAKKPEQHQNIFSVTSTVDDIIEKELNTDIKALKKQDPEEIPPPRPPQPTADLAYLPSQPPASFYALRSPPMFKDLDIDDDIPMAPRRRRHHKVPASLSSSDDIPHTSRRRHRTPEPTIPQLTGQLTRACVSTADRSLKRLIQHVTNNVLGNADGKQDKNVIVVILLVLIACLIILGWGDGKNIHHHHWEYFNPPRDI